MSRHKDKRGKSQDERRLMKNGKRNNFIVEYNKTSKW